MSDKKLIRCTKIYAMFILSVTLNSILVEKLQFWYYKLVYFGFYSCNLSMFDFYLIT